MLERSRYRAAVVFDQASIYSNRISIFPGVEGFGMRERALYCRLEIMDMLQLVRAIASSEATMVQGAGAAQRRPV